MKNIFFIFLLSFISFNCSKNNDSASTGRVDLPTITTTAVSNVTSSGGLSGGNITSDGGSPVTTRGICWGTTPGPVSSGNHTSDGNGIGSFISTLYDLIPATTYYLRAFATNSNGTSYGNEISFVSGAAPSTSGVYVAGFENTGSQDVSRVWKNGVLTNLADGSDGSYARSVFVTDNDIYVAGTTTNGATTAEVAMLWKNGVAHPMGSGTANSVYISGSDVYVGGSSLVGSIVYPTIWKNGVPTLLPMTPSNISGEVRSIIVKGTDVYAAGLEYIATGGNFARLWKNGSSVFLTNNTNSGTYAVYIWNSNVYVSGYEDGTQKIWFNGTANPSPNNSAIYSFFGYGPDLYKAGVIDPVTAVYYKTAERHSLTNGFNNAWANSIFVTGSDVYVTGTEFPNAMLWKNDVPTILSTSTTNAAGLSVFVKN